jgi:hypothetical protein
MPKNSTRKQPRPPQAWLRYAGLAGQFLGLIGCGLWLGYWLDGKAGWQGPWLTLALPLLLLVGMLVQLVRDTSGKN